MQHTQKVIRRLQLTVMVIITLCFCIVPTFGPHAAQASAATVPDASDSRASMLSAEHYASKDFSTDMPIIVLEFPEDSTATAENDYFLPAGVQTFEGEKDITLQDAPSFSQDAILRNMTDKTNESDKKHDYYLSFEDKTDLLSLGSADEYFLLGAMSDRSLIRNYIGYTVSAGIWEATPSVALCELFFHTAEGNLYQGVYTLVAMPPSDNSVLLQRSRNGDGIQVDTYSYLNDSTSENMYIPFMESTSWEDRYGDVVGGVNRAEQVLYSTDSAIFYTAPDYFDIDSVISRFILGELTENYTGMSECYYYFDPETEVMSVAPIWDFEYAFDNDSTEPAVVDEIRYDESTYLAEFFKSPNFTETVQKTYLSLRGDTLNEPALKRIVDTAVSHVAPAAQRDWARWDSYRAYTLEPVTEIEQEDGTLLAVSPFSRQAASFEEEILRIRYHLRTHSLYMAVDITQFEFTDREVSKEITLTSNPLWPIIFLVALFSIVVFARRYGT